MAPIAFVFGNERMGLARRTWRSATSCWESRRTPTLGRSTWRPAVQLVAYDWRQALGGFPSRGGPKATKAARGRASTRLYATARDDLFVSVDDMHDDAEARSQFGTKDYWDDMYRGLEGL